MIECMLRDLREFHSVLEAYNPKKTKKGLYSGSNFFHLKGYGRDRWVVIVQIDVDYEKYLAKGFTQNEILNHCIEFLNLAPPRKKYAKKTPKPLYGELCPHKALFKKDERGIYIESYLTTDQRKNKNFWGEGKIFRKRKRKTKK